MAIRKIAVMGEPVLRRPTREVRPEELESAALQAELLATLRQTFLASDLHSRLQVPPTAEPAAPEPAPYAFEERPADRQEVASWFAPVCRECPAWCGVIARNREGRVVKLEGNPDHPVNAGALCMRGQAALQGLYHPDRITGPLVREGSAGSLSSKPEDGARPESARAAARLQQALDKGVDPVPCPVCGHFQGDMVREAKKRAEDFIRDLKEERARLEAEEGKHGEAEGEGPG